MNPKPFMHVKWEQLAFFNFRAEAAELEPFVPAGTELDLHRGRALVSLVGFRFRQARLFGLQLPFHQDFPELNLRLYVKRKLPDGKVRRGVVFVREIVPKRMTAWVARYGFGEPFDRRPMRHRHEATQDAWAFRAGGQWRELGLKHTGQHEAPVDTTEARFLVEHYWAYCPRRKGRTAEYQVRHRPWKVARALDADVDPKVAAYYPEPFRSILRERPSTAFAVDGSDVEVLRGDTLRAKAN